MFRFAFFPSPQLVGKIRDEALRDEYPVVRVGTVCQRASDARDFRQQFRSQPVHALSVASAPLLVVAENCVQLVPAHEFPKFAGVAPVVDKQRIHLLITVFRLLAVCR